MKLSTSGATITVMKTADEGPVLDRVLAQGWWLSSFDDPRIVPVTVYDHGYTMPCLTPPHFPLAKPSEVAHDILQTLNDVVWRRHPWGEATTDVVTHLDYLERLGRPELVKWFSELNVSDRAWQECDTHGDPTLENIMYDDEGGIVLIDPIPDAVIDGKMPPVRAVDLGKMLQSALGYELIKRDLAITWEWDVTVAQEVRRHCRDSTEWDFACYFAAVHLARIIPYQPDDMKYAWERWYHEITDEVLR